MAGSYKHVVDDEGRLLANEDLVSMLENGGDVYEAVEEMYGMIWSLADRVLVEIRSRSPHSTKTDAEFLAEIVEDARTSYKSGLRVSPGTGAELVDEEDE